MQTQFNICTLYLLVITEIQRMVVTEFHASLQRKWNFSNHVLLTISMLTFIWNCNENVCLFLKCYEQHFHKLLLFEEIQYCNVNLSYIHITQSLVSHLCNSDCSASELSPLYHKRLNIAKKNGEIESMIYFFIFLRNPFNAFVSHNIPCLNSFSFSLFLSTSLKPLGLSTHRYTDSVPFAVVARGDVPNAELTWCSLCASNILNNRLKCRRFIAWL